MLALTGCTGKIGGAVLSALLEHNLIPANQLVICTSSSVSSPRFNSLKSNGAQIRQANYDDPSSMETAYTGCTKLFLVSTPLISLDFNNAPPGTGREKHHIDAINAAVKAGVRHIYYTSLAFGSDSEAGVMQAHLRTERHLKSLEGVKYTIIREGLYNESWPLYLGYYDPKGDERRSIIIAGDGPISWTAISDLGLGTALVLVDEEGKWNGKMVYLSNLRTKTLNDVARIVENIKAEELGVKVVSREEYVQYYTAMGKQTESVDWWSSTYKALVRGECAIKDRALIDLLESRGVEPKPIEATIREMLSG